MFFFLQAVGIFKKPRAKDLAMFLTGKLYINVGTSYRQVSALRGKIEHTEHDSTIDILKGGLIKEINHGSQNVFSVLTWVGGYYEG